MAGLFRSSRRPTATPTMYSLGLQPVASVTDSSNLSANFSGIRSPSPRLSRSDLDFETVLRGDGTVHLREGVDVTSLGVTSPDRPSNVDQSKGLLNKPISGLNSRSTDPAKTLSAPSPTAASTSSSDDMTPTPTPSRPNKGALVVVPPTPETSSKSQSQHGEGQSRSGAFFKAQAAAASTPDLRKNGNTTKSADANINNLPNPQNQYSTSFLSPSQSNATMRPRLRGSSSTSSFSMVSATSPKTPSGKETSKNYEVDNSSRVDWGLTSPRSRSGSKSGRSMRIRATNFIGKMLGQDISRDKPQKVSSSPSPGYVAPPLFARYASQNQGPPPVPQLPEQYQSTNAQCSSPADVFTSPSPSLDFSKPLPRQPKSSQPSSEETVEEDFLISDNPPKSSIVNTTIKSRHTRAQESVSSARRRSASLGDVERQKTSTESVNSQPSFKTAETSSIASRSSLEMSKMPATSIEWDTSNFMKLFKGELSQLDPISTTPLEITDPSSPERQLSNRNRSRSNTTDQFSTSRSEGSSGTIRPRLSETVGRPGPLGIDTTLDNLKVDVDASGSSTMKRSPASASSNRSSFSTPDSPLRGSARRNVTRPTVPPVSASALYASSRAASSSPMLGGPGSSSPRSLNSPPPSFTNPFINQPSVVVSGSTPNRRISAQPRAGTSSSEPVLVGDDADLRRRSSQPHNLSVEGNRTVRLVHSNASISYPFSPSMSQVDLVHDVSPSKSIISLTRGTSLEGEELELKGKELASQCWEDDETFLPKEKIAEWLGGAGRLNAVTLHHYIEFYDFTGLRLDHAFRRFCAKLYLKGETQQIDRILSEFSRRYWECNPNSIYGSASVVHAVAYSILLLNTDLHIADLSTHMSRNQFVRNTLQAVQMQTRQPPNSARASTPDLMYDDASSMHARSDGSDIGGSTLKSRSKRSSSVHSWTSISRETLPPSQLASPLGPSSQNASSISVQTSTSGSISAAMEPKIRSAGSQYNGSLTSIPYGRGWDIEMENILRDIYSAVKTQEIRQPAGFQLPMNQSSTLTPNTPYNTLLRHRNSQRGQDRMAILKRGSMRGLQTLLQTGSSPYSSNSSIEYRDSRDGRVSPSPSFATSMDAVPMNNVLYTPALGFASNLSNTIIREAQEDDVRSLASDGSADTNVSISEEELALLGAPWAKEGILCRKQYWESIGKRAKSKSWQDVFVVIQKGELDMFIFGERGAASGQTVGDGNWLANAQSVGKLQLSHSLAHVLPPPGYNRQRPYCFVLTLSNGGVYFFQAGTEDLLNEWVSTCNYWAARQSKEPLSGGVSNMEYGWNRVLDPLNHTSTIQDDIISPADATDNFSVRSGKSGGTRKRSIPEAATIGRTYDRILIHEWRHPLPPTVSSMHDEETQLEALQKQAELLQTDFQNHNELRGPMSLLYAPRSANLTKAQTNWEKKSQYLLTEIVKYRTYVDSLKAAMSLRLTKRGEKALEKALKSARPDDTDFRGSKPASQPKDNPLDSPVEAETVMGHKEDSEEEVTTPGADTVEFRHKR
ncbi:hypothetical protein Clacol_000713 [Clathrus columnatus]|uniref:SEC7 domain-containing protein n=1 Tax=Clathrus columnatus TaxID=1419009 RepID=A0AAV5A0H3_9AGAM|nr:hypothetical protein Clacol_000713 [Clathrus columnatus]